MTDTVTQIVIGDEMFEAAKGDSVTVHTTTDDQPIEGTFVSLTPRGLRIRSNGGQYVTRKMTVVTAVLPVGDAAEPTGEVTTVAEELPETPIEELPPAAQAEITAAEDAVISARMAEVEAVNLADAEAARAENEAPGGIYGPAVEATEVAEASDVFDPDPIVGGKHLSQMRFSEVMKLAKKYKTPGRGVARIGALREGVAKAIAAEAGRLAG